jgi:pyruvate formate lyase activating enzyme
MLFKKLDNNKIRCLSCKHFCIIEPNNTGICGVRGNKNGEPYLLVYGKPCSLAVDPIEKKPLYHFYPGKDILSIGTFGCNFHCHWCQNWEISQTPKQFKTLEEKLKFIDSNSYIMSPEDVVEVALEYNLDMIAYTYNEPCVFSEYALDISKTAKKHGIKCVFVTSGYESDTLLEESKNLIDAYNVDLKSFSEETYLKHVGARLEYVLDTIEKIYKMGKHIEITTLIIPNLNDSMKELKDIAEFIASIDKRIPWHVSAFHPCYKFENYRSATLDDIKKAYDIGKDVGLEYIYLGNVYGFDNNTYCPKCGSLLIERNMYDVKNVGIVDNKCVNCGYKIYGEFG